MTIKALRLRIHSISRRRKIDIHVDVVEDENDAKRRLLGRLINRHPELNNYVEFLVLGLEGYLFDYEYSEPFLLELDRFLMGEVELGDFLESLRKFDVILKRLTIIASLGIICLDSHTDIPTYEEMIPESSLVATGINATKRFRISDNDQKHVCIPIACKLGRIVTWDPPLGTLTTQLPPWASRLTVKDDLDVTLVLSSECEQVTINIDWRSKGLSAELGRVSIFEKNLLSDGRPLTSHDLAHDARHQVRTAMHYLEDHKPSMPSATAKEIFVSIMDVCRKIRSADDEALNKAMDHLWQNLKKSGHTVRGFYAYTFVDSLNEIFGSAETENAKQLVWKNLQHLHDAAAERIEFEKSKDRDGVTRAEKKQENLYREIVLATAKAMLAVGMSRLLNSGEQHPNLTREFAEYVRLSPDLWYTFLEGMDQDTWVNVQTQLALVIGPAEMNHLWTDAHSATEQDYPREQALKKVGELFGVLDRPILHGENADDVESRVVQEIANRLRAIRSTTGSDEFAVAITRHLFSDLNSLRARVENFDFQAERSEKLLMIVHMVQALINPTVNTIKDFLRNPMATDVLSPDERQAFAAELNRIDKLLLSRNWNRMKTSLITKRSSALKTRVQGSLKELDIIVDRPNFAGRSVLQKELDYRAADVDDEFAATDKSARRHLLRTATDLPQE